MLSESICLKCCSEHSYDGVPHTPSEIFEEGNAPCSPCLLYELNRGEDKSFDCLKINLPPPEICPYALEHLLETQNKSPKFAWKRTKWYWIKKRIFECLNRWKREFELGKNPLLEKTVDFMDYITGQSSR